MRRHLLLLLATLAGTVACDGPDSPASGDGALALAVQESDSLSCGVAERIYSNRSRAAQRLHLKVVESCLLLDSMSVQPDTFQARIWVQDSLGTEVPRSGDAFQDTWRGTVEVPIGGTLHVRCTQPSPFMVGGCTWEYTYSPR